MAVREQPVKEILAVILLLALTSTVLAVAVKTRLERLVEQQEQIMAEMVVMAGQIV
jgi:hypothetical protein